MLKLLALRQKPWSYASLAVQLGVSPSQLHSAIQRALAAQLAVRENDKSKYPPAKPGALM